MRQRRMSFALAAVAALLGLLLVLQIRTQSAAGGLEALTAQELTVLVANLNGHNDQLRAEVATLDEEVRALSAARSRGDTSLGQLESDLTRIQAWAGLAPVSGPGVLVSILGPLPGGAAQDLLDELRNAGAEALAVNDVRVIPGAVVRGDPGQLTLYGQQLPDPFEVRAIGDPEALTGALTRVGGIIAVLAATYPEAQLTVTPLTVLELPATERDMQPIHARPRL